MILIGMLVTTFGTPLAFPQPTSGQDVGKQALSESNYPWYDAETDSLQRIELGERPGIASGERSQISLKPVKANNGTAGPAFNMTGSFFESLSLLAWIAVGLVIAGIAAALFWAFLQMAQNDDKEEIAPRRTMEESIKQLPFELDVDSGDFRSAAQKAYAAHDYRQAIIYLFSHVLVSLDQKNLIRLRKGKTNRQYLQELRSQRSLANYYQRVMVPFESTFFGDHDLEKSEFDSCWNHLDGFQKDIDQTSQVANV